MAKDKTGYLDYDRIIGRDSIQKHNGNIPHDKRFEKFNYFPNVSTKARKTYVVNFNKLLPRDDKL